MYKLYISKVQPQAVTALNFVVERTHHTCASSVRLDVARCTGIEMQSPFRSK